MIRYGYILAVSFLLHGPAQGQSLPLNRQLFFLDERPLEVTFTTDIRKLRNSKANPSYQPANIIMRFPDSSEISEEIKVRPRGIYRKNNCDMAALMLAFKTGSSPKLSPLKKLKLVGGCYNNGNDEVSLLKEYIVYRIYNLISVLSFRTRLLHVTYKDSKEKVKPYKQYAFFIEDIKDLADRNNCIEVKGRKFRTESTDRRQMNLVSLFQYMIGNTDWAVPVNHNIKLVVPKTDTFARPYPVPYDFDYSGFVNARYAIPAEDLNIKSVTQRIYRGFTRSVTELQDNLDIFKDKKEQTLFYVRNFPLLSANEKKQMIRYLEDFFDIIDNKKLSRSIFIDRAGTE